MKIQIDVNVERLMRMENMAFRWWQHQQFGDAGNPPTEEEMESIFHCLVAHDEDRLATILKNYNTPNEE